MNGGEFGQNASKELLQKSSAFIMQELRGKKMPRLVHTVRYACVIWLTFFSGTFIFDWCVVGLGLKNKRNVYTRLKIKVDYVFKFYEQLHIQ